MKIVSCIILICISTAITVRDASADPIGIVVMMAGIVTACFRWLTVQQLGCSSKLSPTALMYYFNVTISASYIEGGYWRKSTRQPEGD